MEDKTTRTQQQKDRKMHAHVYEQLKNELSNTLRIYARVKCSIVKRVLKKIGRQKEACKQTGNRTAGFLKAVRKENQATMCS